MLAQFSSLLTSPNLILLFCLLPAAYFSCFHSNFYGLKSARAVSSIAEGLVLGLAAAAKGDRVFARRNGEFVAEVIDQLHRPLDY